MDIQARRFKVLFTRIGYDGCFASTDECGEEAEIVNSAEERYGVKITRTFVRFRGKEYNAMHSTKGGGPSRMPEEMVIISVNEYGNAHKVLSLYTDIPLDVNG